jgi:hypothetical protein
LEGFYTAPEHLTFNFGKVDHISHPKAKARGSRSSARRFRAPSLFLRLPPRLRYLVGLHPRHQRGQMPGGSLDRRTSLLT